MDKPWDTGLVGLFDVFLFFSQDLFTSKVGFLLPKAPLIVCCQKEVYGGY